MSSQERLSTLTLDAASPRVRAASPLRWIMIGLAFLATVINYLDRQTLSVLADPICKAFAMNNETYGLILSAFMLAYTVSNGVSGLVIDRIGTKLGYALSMSIWSVAGMLHVLAIGPVSLGACRFLLGAGEAGNWPAGVKLASEWFGPRERALACGIFNSGAALGAVIAPPLVAFLALKFGWRSAFLFIGLGGFFWLILWTLVYRRPARVGSAAAPKPARPWRLLRTRFVAAFTLSKFFMDPVWYFYIFWFPKYLATVHHFDLKKIGFVAWIPYLTADAGNVLGGLFTTFMIHRGVATPVARKLSVTFFALIMTAAIPAALTANVWLAIALVSTATLGYTGFLANTLAFPADVFPESSVASVYGLASMGAGFGGMLFAWLSGRAIDRVGYVPVFICYGIMPVISLLVVLFLLGELKPHRGFTSAD